MPIADRRTPLARIAAWLGNGELCAAADGLATGAALLDQSWHYGWLFAAALIASGGAR